jgi:hypothetical protein
MSYNVNLNGQTTETTSFEAAKNIVKAGVAAFAETLAQPVRAGLYRSPKTTARVNADRLRSAAKLAGGVKLPKKAEDVSGNVGGFAFAIARK